MSISHVSDDSTCGVDRRGIENQKKHLKKLCYCGWKMVRPTSEQMKDTWICSNKKCKHYREDIELGVVVFGPSVKKTRLNCRTDVESKKDKDIRQQGHYTQHKIQPVVYIGENRLDFLSGNVVKYVSRYNLKGGVQDLEKARHYLDMLIQREKGEPIVP